MGNYIVEEPVSKFADIDLSKSYTYADYLKWEFDERLELIKGRIFKMSPAPGRSHQELSLEIARQFANYLKDKSCKAYAAPFDVRLSRRSKADQEILTVVQPDICVICDLSKLDERGCLGAPDIVVEILSPGNNKKELRNKYEVYEETGVKEYWIVSPQDKTFLKYTLSGEGKFTASRLMTTGDEVSTPILPGFVMDLEEVFREI